MTVDRYNNLYEECYLLIAQYEGIRCAEMFMVKFRKERSEQELEELLINLKEIKMPCGK